MRGTPAMTTTGSPLGPPGKAARVVQVFAGVYARNPKQRVEEWIEKATEPTLRPRTVQVEDCQASPRLQHLDDPL